MAKHTPGPWHVTGSEIGGAMVVSKDEIIARWPVPPKNNSVANALLISSAPDLLEAAKPVLNELKTIVREDGGCDHSVGICWCDVYGIIEKMEQAIAKAEGNADA